MGSVARGFNVSASKNAVDFELIDMHINILSIIPIMLNILGKALFLSFSSVNVSKSNFLMDMSEDAV